jgi:hypothetical protein
MPVKLLSPFASDPFVDEEALELDSSLEGVPVVFMRDKLRHL